MDVLLAQHNNEVVWTDNRHRGYVRLVLTRNQATADIVTVSQVDAPDYEQNIVKTLRVAKTGSTLQFI
jgi:alkaline phosphatase D